MRSFPRLAASVQPTKDEVEIILSDEARSSACDTCTTTTMKLFGRKPRVQPQQQQRKPEKVSHMNRTTNMKRRSRLPLRSLLCFGGHGQSISSLSINHDPEEDEEEEEINFVTPKYSPPKSIADIWLGMGDENGKLATPATSSSSCSPFFPVSQWDGGKTKALTRSSDRIDEILRLTRQSVERAQLWEPATSSPAAVGISSTMNLRGAKTSEASSGCTAPNDHNNIAKTKTTAKSALKQRSSRPGLQTPGDSRIHFEKSKDLVLRNSEQRRRGQGRRFKQRKGKLKSRSSQKYRDIPSPPPRDSVPKHLEDYRRRGWIPIPHDSDDDSDTMASSEASAWKSAADPKTGRTYYYNNVTRETQWRKPLELASETERAEMIEKEKKQKNFFAAMEANILKSLAVGKVSSPKPTPAPKKDPSLKKLKKTSLVRTISALPDNLLKDLVQRVPSSRRFTSAKKRKGTTGKRGSLDFMSLRSSTGSDAPLDTLNETAREQFSFEMSKPTNLMDSQDIVFLPTNAERTDDAKPKEASEEASVSGDSFSSLLNREESMALSDLIKATEEMADMSGTPDLSFSDGLDMNSLSLDKSMGDAATDLNFSAAVDMNLSLTDMNFDPDEEDDEDDVRAVNKVGGHLGAADLNLSSDSLALEPNGNGGGSKQPAFPSPRQFSLNAAAKAVRRSSKLISQKASIRIASIKGLGVQDIFKDGKKPEMLRRNTCNTLYVGSTMSAPDKDATIKCVCGVYRAHIVSSEEEEDGEYDPTMDHYRKFNDRESQRKATQTISEEFTAEDMNLEDVEKDIPSLDQICSFYRDVFRRAQMESDCIIMSLIYVERLIKVTNGELRPRKSNWRSILFSCMILSSKVWDDLSMWNADFSQTCPNGVVFPLPRINELEIAVLTALHYKVKVPASEYAKYYFLLRSMLIKSGLSEGDDIRTMMPLDIEGAKKLELVSATFQSAANKRRVRRAENLRSKSMGEAERRQLRQGAQRAQQQASLEQMVKL